MIERKTDDRKTGYWIYREMRRALELKDDKKSVERVWKLGDKVWLSEDSHFEEIYKVFEDADDTIWVDNFTTLFEWMCHELEGFEEWLRKKKNDDYKKYIEVDEE